MPCKCRQARNVMIQLRCVGVSRISVCGMPASRVHFSAERLAYVLLGAFTQLRMSFGGPAHKPDAEQQQQAATQPYKSMRSLLGAAVCFCGGLEGVGCLLQLCAL